MPPTLVGQTLLSQYRVDEFIALTPIGELYRAWDTWHNRYLGLTILPEEIADDAEALKEIEAQSSALRKISHPNLTSYLGLYQTAKNAFLLESWVDGPSLRDVISRAVPGINEIFIYTKALCNALEHIHKQGLLHLALAPEMIRIDGRGGIFLSGIGTLRQIGDKGFLRAGEYLHHYAAPEQFQNKPLSPAADIYSLSVILYEVSTGKWLNGKNLPKSPETIRETHLNKIPKSPIELNPDIPDHFSRMLLWALRKNPGDRLATTTELLSTLALAAQIKVDKVPPRADPGTAPITGAILADWPFLPTAQPNIIAADMPPLEERLALATAPLSPKPTLRARLIPIVVILLLAMIGFLLWQVRPVQTDILTPLQNTSFASDYTPPPTLTSVPQPIEPHSRRIVFTCTRGDYNHLCMIDEDGRNLQRLSDLEANDYYSSFSLDGNSVLFASNRNGVFDIFLMSFSERQLFQLTDHVGNVVSPDFSPDGRRIVFANRATNGSTSIWMVNSNGLNAHQVYAGINTIVATRWSPDGETIAYAMSIGIPNDYEIFTMDVDGKNHRRISQGLLGIGGSIDWSPNSRYLLVYAGPVGDKDIFQINVATGDSTQLTDGGNNAAASYSPDGEYIAFNSLRNNDQADIYIMNADGSRLRQLTDDPEPDWGPRWEP
jgi:serine/threonine protein kinase